MGGLLHLVDEQQDIMTRRVSSQKRHKGGLEAPRNSLELPVETWQSYFAAGDDGLRTHRLTPELTESDCFSMKKLINEEISKKPKARINAPSIVARLMGVDTLPVETTRVEKNEKFPKEKPNGEKSITQSAVSSKHSWQTSFDFFHHYEERDTDDWRPLVREHPQEEELQKFKKEFEAFQAARLQECSKIVKNGTGASQWIAQQNLNKQKMVLYANSATKRENNRERAFDDPKPIAETGYWKNQVSDNDFFSAKRKETCSRKVTGDFDQEPFSSDAPTRIVILRPGLDSIGSNEEPWASSSEERDSIEDFLEEVKERLKCELQGKKFKGGSGMVRGGGIETPYSEKPSDPRHIAQCIAKQVRDTVTKDLGMKLPRSESARSYRGECQYNGESSPEFISRDTRKILSERLRNVVKSESHDFEKLVFDGAKFVSKSSLNPVPNTADLGKMRDEHDIQSRSFRFGPDDDVVLHTELSPRNLIRSLSAPVSGTSFGKLLIEDPHVLTGAHIRRKHESVEKLTAKVKKQRREKFNFREKVSRLKYSFILRGMLFGRKLESSGGSRIKDVHDFPKDKTGRSNAILKERDFVKDLMNGPTVVLNLGHRRENSTEVPPSPASVCSSVHDEFWRPANCTSPRTPGTTPPDDSDLPQIFRDISSNLNELRRQLNQLESGDSGTEERQLEAKMPELECQEENYVRDLLLASGLYHNSSDVSLSRWDHSAKPISNRIFELVEDSYCKKKESLNDEVERKLSHKVLFDLVNETISIVLGPPKNVSKFRRKAMGSSTRLPRGKVLLDHTWEMMRVYIFPGADKHFFSIDGMVAQDLESNPWMGLINHDVDAMGKELECEITRDLIEEMVEDMKEALTSKEPSFS